MMMSDLDDDDNDKEEGTCEHQQDSPFIQQERLIFDSTPSQPFSPRLAHAHLILNADRQ
jgi:hypothetical protein